MYYQVLKLFFTNAAIVSLYLCSLFSVTDLKSLGIVEDCFVLWMLFALSSQQHKSSFQSGNDTICLCGGCL